MTQESINKAKQAIKDVREGKMVILVDDEDRENEGDLTMAAELVTPEAIAFMATKACGLICVTLTSSRIKKLDLPMMVNKNQTPLGTAFTVSIEATNGVSTGISAADRARTIKIASDPKYGKEDIISPGHVFPLKSMPGGVLQRAGQTEGSVDLARLAGLTPAGVICEIMKSDGTMARMPDLSLFAKEHSINIVSIADLVKYRLQRDRLVEKIKTGKVELGDNNKRALFDVHIFHAAPGIVRREYAAFVLGDISDGKPVPCRAHVGNLLDDVLGGNIRPNSPSVKSVINAIIKAGRGILLYLPSRQNVRDELFGGVDIIKGKKKDAEGVIREYGIGAQILFDLGVKKLQVISNNPHRIIGLKAWGFKSVEQITLEEV